MPNRIAALRRNLVAACRKEGERRQHPFPGPDRETTADLFISRAVRPALHDDDAVAAWVDAHRSRPRLKTRPIPLDRMERWTIDPESGNIGHVTGRFFSITGVRVRHRFRDREIDWDQPIIDQPEVGILGLLAKRIGGVLHFCLQAKEEPGNIGGMQLSPTVQATRSNYSRAHGGALPPFVEHFIDPPRERVLYAKLQTEDGGRFLYKSNRNMIVRLADAEDETLPDDFIWLTLRQIAGLLQRDNLIHACTRSILACLLPDATPNACFAGGLRDPHFAELWAPAALAAPPRRLARTEEGAPLAEIVQWLDDQKAINHFLVKRVGLATLEEWRLDGEGFLSHRDGRFFRIIGLDVSGESREVPAWSQPILDNPQSGIIGLLVREREGRRSFLMQAKAEVGNRITVQLGPTVQFTPSNYSGNERLPKPFLFEAFSDKPAFPVLWENRQAEEGARFYHEDHLHRILLLPPETEFDLPPDFRWLSEEEVRFFLHLGEQVNSCARSILACLL